MSFQLELHSSVIFYYFTATFVRWTFLKKIARFGSHSLWILYMWPVRTKIKNCKMKKIKLNQNPLNTFGAITCGHTLYPYIAHFMLYIFGIIHLCKCMCNSYIYWTVHHCNSWKQKTNLMSLAIFISLLMHSTGFGHKYIHYQELTTILLNYHIVRVFCKEWRV